VLRGPRHERPRARIPHGTPCGLSHAAGTAAAWERARWALAGARTAAGWGLEVADNTTGQSDTTDHTYNGPGTSAEWIVEVPPLDGTQLPVGDYSPDVTFSGVAVNRTQVALDQVFMLQDGLLVSFLSAFDANGVTVAYGPAAPPAP